MFEICVGWLTVPPARYMIKHSSSIRKRVLIIHWSQIISVLTCALLVIGCQKKDELAELTRQSPFKTSQETEPRQILVVSCYCYPLELPGQVDVMALEFWKTLGNTPDRAGVGPHADAGIFPPDRLRLWRENGLHLSVVPLKQWDLLREELLRAGGVAHTQTVSLIRSPAQVVQFFAFWVELSPTIFVAGPSGPPRGYTLGQGDCLFSINCVPEQNTSSPDSFYLKIAPQFHADQPYERIGYDEFGVLRRISETPVVVFDQLTLEASLPKNHFICLAADTSSSRTDNLGGLFLTRTEGTENYQLVLIILPDMQTGTEV